MSEYVFRNLLVKRAKYLFFLIPSCGMSTRLISKDLYCSSLKLWSHIEDHVTPWYSQFQKERSGQRHLWGFFPEAKVHKMLLCVHVSCLVRLFVTPWTVACSSRLSMGLCPRNFPGKNTGVGCHILLQEIFPTQGFNTRILSLLHWQADSLPLYHLGSPKCYHLL